MSQFGFPGPEYIKLPRAPKAWLIEHIVPASGSVMLYGDPKVGKSYAALQMSVAITRNQSWMGYGVHQSGRVLYVQMDTPRGLWMERLDDLEQNHNIPILSPDIIFADRETMPFPFDVNEREHWAALRSLVVACQPVAVILDTIREMHDGNENDSTPMKKVMGLLTAACSPAAMVLISHPKKPSYDAPPSLINDTRGSTYINGKVDCIVRFTKKAIHLIGRAIEETTIPVERQASGFWGIAAPSEFEAHLQAVMEDGLIESDLGRAKALAALSGKGIEACRSAIRRYELEYSKSQTDSRGQAFDHWSQG